MKKPMKKLMLPLCAALGLLATVSVAPAQEWPGKEPIKVIVPFTPGSATDIVARAVFNQVSQQSGQAVVVENRGGGGTTIGSAAVAHADPDGYTLLVNSTSHVVVASTYAHLSYSVADDFTALTSLASQPFVATAPTKFKTMADFVAYGRAHPGALNYGSNGVGTAGQLFMLKIALAAKITMTHIPFRGTADAMTEMIANRLDLFPAPAPAMVELAKAGQVSALAVSTVQRSQYMPDVPTVAEAGLPEATYNFWIGAFAPAKMPPQLAARIHDEIVKALNSPEVKKEVTGLAADPMPMPMADFDAFVRKEIKLNADIVAAAGIKPE
jgi:tripartite-type tricarboxylate transporter receptor subunit TctC